jgi:glycosidase
MPNPIDLHGSERPSNLESVRALLDEARRSRIRYFDSPVDWRDEVLYFLLPDRFSDGKEATRALLSREEINTLRETAARPDWNWRDWAESGKRWQGGTIKGIQAQLDYLKDLGVTTIWVGPVFKQRARLDTYHGYGIQDFLDVDPRFGSRQDLIELVKAAHERELRVILDIIVNHSGDNWGYVPPQKSLEEAQNEPGFVAWPNYYGGISSDITRDWQLAWRDDSQVAFTTEPADVTRLNDGVWPADLRSAELYTRAGKGDLGAGGIADPHAEHKRTDFFSLKDFALDVADNLSKLADCYKYWIALTDCDGFRIDTVKHMSLEEARNYCGAIREFADTLGKRNFFLVGEIAGGDFFQDFVLDNLALLQRNMSAALDIGSARLNLNSSGKGLVPGGAYLNSFDSESQGFASHRSLGDRHVSIVDDHDHVFGSKVRFSAEIPDDSPVKDYQVVAATAIQMFTLGIPCIYYGTEQAFAGPAHSQLPFVLAEGWNDGGNSGDRYLREAIFGPAHPRAHHDNDLDFQVQGLDQTLPGFGPFGTAGKHCFDPNSPAYVRIAALGKVRAEYPILRIGRQYPRQIRIPGTGFEFPKAGEIVPWSRILDNQEAVCIVNPNGAAVRGGDVVVAAELWAPGTTFTVIANSAQVAAGPSYGGTHPMGSKVAVQRLDETGPAYLEIRDVQAAEVLVLLKEF